MAAKQHYLVRFVCDHNGSVGSNMANNEKQTSSWLTYKVQKWHTLPSGFDKQLRNSSTTLRNNLPRNNKSAATTSYVYEILQNSANTPMFHVLVVSHEAESFAQRECDVITARPITRPTGRPKSPQSFR